MQLLKSIEYFKTKELYNLNCMKIARQINKEAQAVEYVLTELVWKVIKSYNEESDDWISIHSKKFADRLQHYFGNNSRLKEKCGFKVSYAQFVDDFLVKKMYHHAASGTCTKYVVKDEIIQLLEEEFKLQFDEPEVDISDCIERMYINTNTDKLSAYKTAKDPKGRLFTDGITLQNCSSELRESMLSGQIDYDIDSCHPTFLKHFSSQFGYSNPFLDELVNKKKEIRERLAKECEADEVTIKKVMIALMYGAKLQRGSYNSISQIGDLEKQQKFIDAFQPYKLAMDCAVDVILKFTKGSSIKECTKLAKEDKKHVKNDASTISYYFQRHEREILNNMIAATGKFSVLQHDGLTSTVEIDTVILEKNIYKKTGIPVKISKEKLGENK